MPMWTEANDDFVWTSFMVDPYNWIMWGPVGLWMREQDCNPVVKVV